MLKHFTALKFNSYLIVCICEGRHSIIWEALQVIFSLLEGIEVNLEIKVCQVSGNFVIQGGHISFLFKARC